LKVHRSRSVRRARVTADGRNLVSHAGTALLAELADRIGLTSAMSAAMADCGISWHTHDPGVVLTHLAVAIAGGADCLSDMAVLKEQSELFGPVASVATAWRAVEATTSAELRAIPKAIADAREVIWSLAPPEHLVIDFDATLVTAHSDKQDARPTYKGGYGFHPFGSWCDTTSEPLAAMLRPGNAGANDTDDHLELLDQTICSLPSDYRVGHEEGDDPAQVRHEILVRADSAAASHVFCGALSDANIDFSIGFRVNGQVRDALLLVQEEDWVRAIEPDGTGRPGAWVYELTELVDLDTWPEDTRLICRRERPHPGAQQSLFDTQEGFRHTCFITNTKGQKAEQLELRHRGHARVEDRVRTWKDCGLQNLPFEGYARNEAWLAVTVIAGALIAWSQLACFTGDLAKVEPKAIRYRVLHIAALVVRRGRTLALRIDETWPWSSDLVNAFSRLRAAFP
jgi:Transposase DDE domain group 1